MYRKVKNQRRYRHIEYSIPVILTTSGGVQKLVTHNISRHGAFVLTDSPIALRQLANLEFQLPGGVRVNVMGRVARLVMPDDSAPTGPGMGVDFFSLTNNAKKIWNDFCLELENARSEEEDDPMTPDATLKAKPIRRKSPRYILSFLVRMRDKDRMREFYTRNISRGGMFLNTPLLRNEGEDLEVLLIHPDTHQEYPILSRVIRVESGPPAEHEGMGVEFLGLDENTKSRIQEFIETGIRGQSDDEESDRELMELLEKAVQLDPDSPRTRTAFGKTLLVVQEDPLAAVKHLEHAIAIDPDYLPAHQCLPLAYALLGENDKAMEQIRTIRRLQHSMKREADGAL